MAIAVQSDPNEIADLKNIFQELDKNGDGSISFDELQVGLGKRENGAELMAILRAADTDGNGTINYTGKGAPSFIICRVFGGNHELPDLPEGAISSHCFQDVRQRQLR